MTCTFKQLLEKFFYINHSVQVQWMGIRRLSMS
ncbi:hypothetical protein AVEN109717_04350 [Avibacterium endocarditidis]